MHLIGHTFVRWGFGHWTMLVLTAVGSVVLVVAGRRVRGSPAAVTLSKVFGMTMFVIALARLLQLFLPGNFRIDQSIPLQLSDLLRFIGSYALWSRRFWATSLVYYWGLTFNIQSIITPNLYYGRYPIVDFTAYWSLHILVMWAAIFLTWGLGIRPTWRSYRIAIIGTLVWAAVTFTFNVLAGTNYGFLNAKPSSASLLSVMGPWPFYLLSAFVAMFVIWALITWPWTARRSVTRERPGIPASRG
ncbi:MAG: TIGR02206 family membrane protein [Microlunatus sp.]|nr:TIGR02206 family membrane protein [Microlunatus sp.]